MRDEFIRQGSVWIQIVKLARRYNYALANSSCSNQFQLLQSTSVDSSRREEPKNAIAVRVLASRDRDFQFLKSMKLFAVQLEPDKVACEPGFQSSELYMSCDDDLCSRSTSLTGTDLSDFVKKCRT